MTSTDAYFAGIFDGEGCVEAYMRPRDGSGYNVTARLSVRNNDLALLKEMVETYGGFLRTNRKCGFWIIQGDPAVRFAKRVLPCLRVKRDQVETFLELVETIGKPGVRTSSEVGEYRMALVTDIKNFKRAS